MTESSSPASRVGTVTGPFASLGARFGAFVIDRMLLLAFVAPAAALFYVAFEDGSPGGRQLFFAGIPTLLTLILLIVQWVNLSRRGRTIGGFALGVSIVRGEGGTPLGFGKALLRTVVLQLISSIPLLVIVAMVLSAKHPRRQAWHDSVVGAVVVGVVVGVVEQQAAAAAAARRRPPRRGAVAVACEACARARACGRTLAAEVVAAAAAVAERRSSRRAGGLRRRNDVEGVRI